jgi:RNase P subunit RPR2
MEEVSDATLASNHLLALSRVALSLDPRLSRMYGERLSAMAFEEGGVVSARQFCDVCSMPQVEGLTAKVRLAPLSGARSVQKLRGCSGKNEANIVRTKCLVCGAVGAVWGKAKKKKNQKKRAKELISGKKKGHEEGQKTKKKKKKVETLATKANVNLNFNNATVSGGYGSLDDWLC